MDIQGLKANVDLRGLVRETHLLTKGCKLRCPWHDDHDPSLHVYADGFHCFACGISGDHLDWLMATRALTFKEAAELLSRRAGALGRTVLVSHGRDGGGASRPGRQEKPPPLSPAEFGAHRRRAATLSEVPQALWNRGFTLADCRTLGVADAGGDAIFPVTGPRGEVLAIKCRYAVPRPHRYAYKTPGRGTPAWCSPGFFRAGAVLIVEGELNGMACWLALRAAPRLGVMGTAGAHGPLDLDHIQDKPVYLYADDDEAGREAGRRWAEQVRAAGAKAVYLLKAWPLDACEIAGRFGRPALRNRLARSEKACLCAPAATTTEAAPAAVPASNGPPPLRAGAEVMQACSRARPQLRAGSS